MVQVGDQVRARVGAATGVVIEIFPDGHDVKIRWESGPFVAGRELWCPVSDLDEPQVVPSLETAYQMAMELTPALAR
jgi:hypothetical protein